MLEVMRRSLLAVALVAGAAVLLAGCGAEAASPAVAQGSPAASGAPAPTATSPVPGGSAPASSPAVEPPVPPADPALVEAAATTLGATDLDDEASIRAAVSAIRDEGAAEAAAGILADPAATPGARWAAVLAYGTSGWDPAVLLPVLDDPSPTLRAMAAASLIGWGEAAAIPVLVALTADASIVAGSEPPLEVGAYAAEVLGAFVEGPEVAPGTDLATVNEAWQAWLDGTGGTLVFDPDTGTWTGGRGG